jgi:hypothetical protein
MAIGKCVPRGRGTNPQEGHTDHIQACGRKLLGVNSMRAISPSNVARKYSRKPRLPQNDGLVLLGCKLVKERGRCPNQWLVPRFDLQPDPREHDRQPLTSESGCLRTASSLQRTTEVLGYGSREDRVVGAGVDQTKVRSERFEPMIETGNSDRKIKLGCPSCGDSAMTGW